MRPLPDLFIKRELAIKRELGDMSRQIVQIVTKSHQIDEDVLHALCDDSSVRALYGQVREKLPSPPEGKARA